MCKCLKVYIFHNIFLETHRSLATLRFTIATAFLINARTQVIVQIHPIAGCVQFFFTILCVMHLFRDSHILYTHAFQIRKYSIYLTHIKSVVNSYRSSKATFNRNRHDHRFIKIACDRQLHY